MKLHVTKAQFTSTETLVLENNTTRISTFLYKTGVEAVRISIGAGTFVWLPFFGQSLWSWKVGGIEQKFKGFVSEPDYAARNFLHNYGALMIHCGITAMGNPSKADTHLHHGELPLAKYDSAWIEISDGPFPVSLHGSYQYTVPFIASYEFSPSLRISETGTSVLVDSQLKNLQKTPMEYMYLNHLNLSLDHVTELQYGIDEFNKETVTVLDETIPGVVDEPIIFLHPSKISTISPELVAIMKNKPEYGDVCVNTMIRENHERVWVATNTSTLDHTVAWLTKTLDRSACGFSLPATAGPRGRTAESKQGNMKLLEPESSIRFQFAFGLDENPKSKSLQTAITMLGGIV